jgi:signal transduction histidine kinase/ligand-binding sensor domain-containing protein
MRIVLLIYLLLLNIACAAQAPLRVVQYNVDQGLSQSSVYSIFQDHYGFIWMATGDGLNRFDGSKFIAYKGNLTNAGLNHFRDRNINSDLFEDRNGNIWFNADEGVYTLNRRSGKVNISLAKYETEMTAKIIGVDSLYIWGVVHGKGVFQIDVKDLTRKWHIFNDTFHRSRSELTIFLSGTNTSEDLVLADTKGLMIFDKVTFKEKRLVIKTGINAVYPLSNGKLLFAENNRITIFDKTTGQQREIPVILHGKPTAIWSSIAMDTANGLVYIAEKTGGAICIYDQQTSKIEITKIPNISVHSLFIDQSRNLWVGTDGAGAFKIDIKPPKFHAFVPDQQGNGAFMVKSIFKDDSGLIWLTAYDTGLIVLDPATKKSTLVRNLGYTKGTLIGNLMLDSSGLLVFTINDRIIWLNRHNRMVKEELTLPMFEQLSGTKPVIYALTEFRKGQFLVGTDIGLFIVSESRGRHTFVIEQSLRNDTLINGWVYNLTKQQDGTILIGKRNGFAKIRLDSNHRKQMLVHGMQDIPVRNFYKSEHAPILWLATEQGLIAFNELNEKYTVFDEQSGIANSFLYALLPENDSTLWMSTNKGISKASIRYAADHSTKVTFTNYNVADGLQSNEFNTGAYFKCADGTMMFGGIAGINWFLPNEIVPNTYKAKPAITGISINDQVLSTDTTMYIKELSLPYDRSTISFSVRALEFTQPHENAIAYKMEGLDNHWVYTANDIIRYANLAPGQYKFLVKARNNETTWNEEALQLLITINPPFWQTLWFKCAIALLIALMIFAWVRYIISRKVRMKTQELQKQHALNLERLRISKDVHDDIGSGLSKISLLSEMASMKINNNIAPNQDIEHISNVSKELVDNMHDLIWVLNPENTTLDNLVSRIREYCADYMDGVACILELSFHDDIPDLNISREVQRNIFSTIKEALNNAVRHANATRINVTLNIVQEVFSIEVADNGKGFASKETQDRGNGLRNMKQRLGSIGGTCVITSAPDKGTRVALTISLSHMADNA